MLFSERQSGSNEIQWGKVVAGVAVATGAIMLGVALTSGDIPILSEVTNSVIAVAQSVGEQISAVFTASPELPKTNVFEALGELFSKVGTFFDNNLASIGGATLLAGGLGYFTMHYENQAIQGELVPATSQARLQNAQMGFAAREQMRATNALMQARMQAFGQAPSQNGQER